MKAIYTIELRRHHSTGSAPRKVTKPSATVFRKPFVLGAIIFGLATPGLAGAANSPTPLPPIPASELSSSFGTSTHEAEGVDSAKLLDLTNWVRDGKLPIFSILISRDGKLVYELYTSSLGRDEAHYVMSITKSFTSALVGVAIDRHLIPGADAPLGKVLPAWLFADKSDIERFAGVTVKDVLGMSALDADEPPHSLTPEDVQRGKDFTASKNRTAFALTQKTLPTPGSSFQYNDITPQLVTGMIEYATKETALQFAQDTLFGPLGFRNQEWTGQDATGIDNGAYGLRLRPLDMQKFGILYLRGGKWNAKQLVSKAWVDLSFQPWIRSQPKLRQPDYGWYWWSDNFGAGWTAHVANGWRGQRIAVIPEQEMVVTITGDIEDGSEDKVFDQIMRDYIVPASNLARGHPANSKSAALLADALAQLRTDNRIPPQAEKRMIPSIAPREKHHDFMAAATPAAK